MQFGEGDFSDDLGAPLLPVMLHGVILTGILSFKWYSINSGSSGRRQKSQIRLSTPAKYASIC